MIELSTGIVDPTNAPPLAPIEHSIDVAHLARMTLGDDSLQREVLQLFTRQAEILITRMQRALPTAIAAYAHTLKGSSQSIGAWQVARAAETLELAARGSASPADIAAAIKQLAAALDEARAAITEILRAH